MQRILIIKTGAAGDVVRTTSLLHVLDGSIAWVVNPEYADLLPVHDPRLEIIDLHSAGDKIGDRKFDLVISLEENEYCAKLASSIKADHLIGIFWIENRIAYTKETEDWFDMSLVSTKGKGEADKMKENNTNSFQSFLFKMIGKEFSGEPYLINNSRLENKESLTIGIEKRVGPVWPNKAWGGYEDLVDQLKIEGYTIKIFEQQKRILDYMLQVESCSCIISGDTLAMHLALAYRIPSIAIFNCTSPNEIYDYGLLKKIVSPLLHQHFYSKEKNDEVINSVQLVEVYRAFKELGVPTGLSTRNQIINSK